MAKVRIIVPEQVFDYEIDDDEYQEIKDLKGLDLDDALDYYYSRVDVEMEGSLVNEQN